MDLDVEFRNGWRLHSAVVARWLGVPHTQVRATIANHYKAIDTVGYGLWESGSDYWLEQCHIDLLICYLFKGDMLTSLMATVSAEFTNFKKQHLKSGGLV